MKIGILFALVTLSFAGCTAISTPVLNQVNLSESDFSKVDSMKRGEDCSSYVLFFGPFGSQSLRTAVRNGKISHVKAVDEEVSTYVVYSKSCIIAYGE